MVGVPVPGNATDRSLAPSPFPAIPQTGRPLVIILPGGQVTGSGVSSTDEADGETLSMRAMKAAGKVRDLLNEARTMEAILYSPDMPLFKRAALEAKLKVENRYRLTASEQTALGKAAGAIYVAVVSLRRAPDGGPGYEIALDGIDTTTGKSYGDAAKYNVSRAAAIEVNALSGGTRTVSDNAISSAANTLVTRLLNGPLAAYGRMAPPPVLVAPKTDPGPGVSADADTEADTIQVTLQEASSMLADGNNNGAIVLLRHTINQSPLNLKLRLLLARSYVASRRNTDAATEIKRCLMLITPSESERKEAIGVLAEALQQSGNIGAARATYEDILAAHPEAVWAHLALADLLKNEAPSESEKHYRAVLSADPTSVEAARGLARLLATRGNFSEAVSAVVPAGETPVNRQMRYTTAAALFDEFAGRAVASLRKNRTAWENREMTRENFYKATVTEVTQAGALIRLLKTAPPLDTDAAAKKAHSHRVLAASLLSQAAIALQTFLENGDKESGAQSALWLTECARELAAVR
ncbi:MAG: tetratricopeptide repeat protein [Capsulimonadales bacterium]|nr:tetratricopeptide repeat protein [Capsulimonadales bacterium]